MSFSIPTDGQTNMKKPIVAFRNFAKALKNAGKGPFVDITINGG